MGLLNHKKNTKESRRDEIIQRQIGESTTKPIGVILFCLIINTITKNQMGDIILPQNKHNNKTPEG